MKSFTLIFTLAHLIFSHAASITGDIFCNNYLCVQSIIQNGNIAYFQIETSYKVGWVSIGIGSGMIGGDLLIFWPYWNASSSSNYSTGYSRRKTSALVTPTPIPDQSLLNVISELHVNYTQQTVIFQFSRPVIAPENDLSLSSNGQSMIWAYSDQRPSGYNVDTNLAKHINSGHFKLKLSAHPTSSNNNNGNNGNNSTNSNSSFSNSSNSNNPFTEFPTFQFQTFTPASRYDRYVIAHAIVMFLSLAVVMPLAVLFPAILRSILQRHWFPIHAAIQLGIMLPLSIAGAYLAKKASMGTHFVSRHQILGTIIYIIILIQLFLGIAQNFKYRLNMKKLKKLNDQQNENWDKTSHEGRVNETSSSQSPNVSFNPRPVMMHHFHYFIGYTIPILVLIQIPFGLQEYGPGSTPFGVWLAWWIYTGILMAAWIASIGNRLFQLRSRVVKNETQHQNVET